MARLWRAPIRGREPGARSGGTTLIELMVATVVFGLVVASLFAALETANTTSKVGDGIGENTEKGSLVAERLKADLQETRLDLVDTAFRRHGVPGFEDGIANHFPVADLALSSCTSAFCPWNTTRVLGATVDRFEQVKVGRNLVRSGGASWIESSGRVWRNLGSSICPLDGNYVATGATLDILSLFTPRDASGAFVTGQSSAVERALGHERKPDWQGIVFYYPVVDRRTRELELRRTVVYRSDLLAGVASSSPDWTSWDSNDPPGEPTLIDLFDFGTDGTTDGIPDGSIPLVPAAADSHVDRFEVVDVGTESWIVREKTFDSGTAQKICSLWIERETGRVVWTCYFENDPDGDGADVSYWYRSASFSRRPQVGIRGLVDIDFSTAVSNPLSSGNPYGVGSAGGVRVTFVVERAVTIGGRTRHVESIVDFEVDPRNVRSTTASG